MLREGAGEGGDRAAGDDEEKAPAVEKSGDAAKAVANETVKAASFGIGGGELGIGESAKKRKDATNDPNEEREADGAV